MYKVIKFSQAIKSAFPDTRVFGCQVQVSPRNGRSVDLESDWKRLHARWTGKSKAEVAAHPRNAAYVEFNLRLGLNPKQAPPSVLNLTQRFLIRPQLERIPTINALVDAVNIAAVEMMTPLGIFDAHCIEGDLCLDRASGGEPFHPLGAEMPMRLEPGVVILRDDKKVLSYFCYRDSETQKVTSATTSLWLLGCQVPGITEESIILALDYAKQMLSLSHEVTSIE